MYVPTAPVDDQALPASEDFSMTRGAGQVIEDDRHGLDSRGVSRQDDVPDLAPASTTPEETLNWSAIPGTALPMDGSPSATVAVPAACYKSTVERNQRFFA